MSEPGRLSNRPAISTPEVPSRRRSGAVASARVLGALAANTFLEAVRDRVLYLFLFFGIFVFGASRLLSPLALGEGRRITLDLGFVAISVFGCLTTIFVGHQLIFREVERKTLYFLFSRPLRRSEFVWGKYFGLLSVLITAVVAMACILALVLAASGYAFGWSYWQAALLAGCEMSILAAVALLLAAVTSPVLAGLLTLAAWLIGHGASDLEGLIRSTDSPAVAVPVRLISWIVPRLDQYGDLLPVLQGVSYPWAQIGYGLLYALVYSSGALLLATLVLSRRELAL